MSSLTVENLGFFEVDQSRQRLVTNAKSGGCFHPRKEHIIVTGKPRSVLEQTETLVPEGDVLVETKTLVNGHRRKSSRRAPSQD